MAQAMNMTSVAAMYNTLPTFEEADAKFSNRDEIFSKLGPLFVKYNCKFGVGLVHRHCKLEEGEMMVATKRISQPEKDVQCYPEKWLATGEPYEFSKEMTAIPPEDLFKEFKEIVQSVGVLGLYFIHQRDISAGVLIERTEGRKNITIPSDDDIHQRDISAGVLTGRTGGGGGIPVPGGDDIPECLKDKTKTIPTTKPSCWISDSFGNMSFMYGCVQTGGIHSLKGTNPSSSIYRVVGKASSRFKPSPENAPCKILKYILQQARKAQKRIEDASEASVLSNRALRTPKEFSAKKPIDISKVLGLETSKTI